MNPEDLGHANVYCSLYKYKKSPADSLFETLQIDLNE